MEEKSNSGKSTVQETTPKKTTANSENRAEVEWENNQKPVQKQSKENDKRKMDAVINHDEETKKKRHLYALPIRLHFNSSLYYFSFNPYFSFLLKLYITKVARCCLMFAQKLKGIYVVITFWRKINNNNK